MDQFIHSVEIGNGSKRILMWSQMHGNESTTTKAILDLLNFFDQESNIGSVILNNCRLLIIPILSPDGAESYTRVNANNVDLNRDAQDLSQPESIVLREVFEKFNPHYCFNLHGQRTIYNVGTTDKPASVSFLAPSVDENSSITHSRATAMQVIVAMNKMLQTIILGQVGRYNDGYNINCVGDTFQTFECPTILFEAGHFANDYEREESRKLIFHSLMTALEVIGTETIANFKVNDYFGIPENGKQFFDILIKNVHLFDPKFYNGDRIGILYNEVLENAKIKFKPIIEKTGKLDSYFSHKTYDCNLPDDLLKLRSDYELVTLIDDI